jgi:hypothetical protein
MGRLRKGRGRFASVFAPLLFCLRLKLLLKILAASRALFQAEIIHNDRKVERETILVAGREAVADERVELNTCLSKSEAEALLDETKHHLHDHATGRDSTIEAEIVTGEGIRAPAWRNAPKARGDSSIPQDVVIVGNVALAMAKKSRRFEQPSVSEVPGESARHEDTLSLVV